MKYNIKNLSEIIINTIFSKIDFTLLLQKQYYQTKNVNCSVNCYTKYYTKYDVGTQIFNAYCHKHK